MAYEQFAYYYDRLMGEMPYSEWIRFAQQCWNRFGEPKTVVDLGCGTGNISIPLAQMGFQVFGVDLSAHMLAVARHKFEQQQRVSSFVAGGSVSWLEQDMREWELPEPVDCVLSFCDCINYLLEEEDWIQTFRQVRKGLKSGGLFIFDAHTIQTLVDYAESQPFILNEEDIAYIWTCDLDEERTEITHDLSIFYQSPPESAQFRRIEEVHVQRAYNLDWIRKALKESGFSAIHCYGDFRFDPASEHTTRAFFVAIA